MKVVVEGQSSREAPVLSGVPQGTVLGPILFLLHINDLPDSVSSQVRLFADDCLLYRPIKSFQDHLKLQQDLKSLETWAEKWGMSFNAKKCYILSIKNKSSYMYNLNEHILQVVDAHPYLGVQLSNDLRWTQHINGVAKKASSTLGFLRRNLQSSPPECRKAAYISLVRSTLEYSAIIWDPHHQGEIDRLERIQRKAARFITRDYKSRQPGAMTNMLQKLKLPELQTRRQHLRLAFLFKVARGTVPALPPEEYLTKIENKRRIRPTRNSDFASQNIISRQSRNHSNCFVVPHAKSEVYKNSLFARTIPQWNSLDENIINSPSVASFKSALERTI